MARLGLTRMDPAGKNYCLFLRMISYILRQPLLETLKRGMGIQKMVLIKLEKLLELFLNSGLKQPLHPSLGFVRLFG